MVLIKNGQIVENNQLVTKDILVENGKIKAIGNLDILCENIIDASGCLVMPGAVDVHVHLREPGYENKETVKTGTMSSAKGGVTTIMPMPNLSPCPDNLEHLNKELDILKRDSVVNYYPFGTITVNEEDKVLADIDSFHHLVKAITDDGRGVNNLELLEEACELARKYDLVVASHAEDNFYKYSREGE